MAVSFNQIPSSLRVPLCYVEFDNSGALMATPVMEWRVLLLGAAEPDCEGPLMTPTLITSADQAARLWGQGSMIASMFRFAKRQGGMLETWGLAVPDPEAAVAATGEVTVSGACSQAGIISLYIGGDRVRVVAKPGEEVATIAARLAAAINADGELPVKAQVQADKAGSILLTCRWKGATGNDIDLRVNHASDDALPQGLHVACTAMSNGAGAPEMDGIIAALGDTWWKALACPWLAKSERDVLEEWLDTQFGPLRQQECQVFGAFRGTLAQASAFGNAGNSELVSVMALGASPSNPWDMAAAYALTAATSLADDPARPLQTLELTGIKAPARQDRWNMEERNILLFDGMATYMVASDDTVQIEREVTMYQKNSWGVADPSYLDVQTPATLGYWRYAVRSRITQKFPRCKLADDGTRYGAGQAVVTPSVIRAELVALHAELEEKGLLENAEAFKADLVVERNKDDRNRLDVVATPDLVNQFRIFAMQTRFIL